MDAAILSWTRRTLPGLALALLAGSADAQQYPDETVEGPYAEPAITTRIWFDRGDEPLLDRGDRVRLYYRTSADAFVAVFNIDTNGTVRMLYPRSPEDDHWVRGGRDYRLLFPRSPYWYVDDQPGMGYFFVLASSEPFDLSSFEYSYYGNGWDLTRVGRHVYRDPYVAMDDYVAALIPDWEYVPYALDFATYHVGEERYEYPRFLCYDCHGFRSYAAWNPYHYYCSSFRVVIYDDPWYYPSYRYGGRRVVYAGIPRARLPRYQFKERAVGEAGPPIVVTRATSGARPGVGGDPAPRRIPSGIGSGGERAGAAPRTVAPGSASDPGRRPGIPSDVGIPRRGGGTGVASPSAAGRQGAGSVGNPSVRGGGAGGATGAPTVRRGSGDPDDPAVRGGAGEGEAGEARPTERRYVPVVRPPARPSERTRPVLERRPPTEPAGRGGAGPARRPTGVLPPPAASRGSGGGASAGPTRPTTPTRPSARSGGTPARPTPSTRSGGTPARPTPSVRVNPRSGGGGVAPPARPSVRTPTRSGGSGASARPPTRSGGSGASARPPTRVVPRGGGTAGSVGRSRSGGGSTPARPPARARPPASRSSGGATPRAPVRVQPRGSSGGGSAGARPSATRSGPTTRPKAPVKVKRRGGGGG